MRVRKQENKKAQVTIFVIIALIIVVGMVLLLLLIRNNQFIKIPSEEGIKERIAVCSRDAVQEAVGQLMPHGGYIEAKDPYIMYKQKEVSFLCYTDKLREICTNTEPMLIEKMEDEIQSYIKPQIEKCFEDIAEDYEKYDYQAKAINLEIEIKPTKILIKIEKNISYIKNNQKESIEKFDSFVNMPLWDFARITNEIINQEVSCYCEKEVCNADVFNVAGNYNFEVERFVTGKNEKIYVIREVSSKKEFNFAVRNCVRLP